MFFKNDLINKQIKENAPMDMKEILEERIKEFLNSDKRKNMLIGDRYYNNDHDIKDKTRSVVDSNGYETTARYLPNNKLTDNKFAWLVDQKTNYLLTKPIDVKSEDKESKKILDEVFNRKFLNKLKQIGEDTIIAGVGYLFPYIKDNEIKFKRFLPWNIIPIYKNNEEEELESFIRVYPTIEYQAKQKIRKTKVEHCTKDGVAFYELNDGKLTETDDFTPYIYVDGKGYRWRNGKVPLIVFKYNSREIPLILRVKSLQDALNMIISTFADNISEDVRSTVLVLKNYMGENLAEFRRNLATYGVVKVATEDGVQGGVETLKIEVNTENYALILQLLKKAIIENGRGFDVKDERMTNNPNQMNIRSMYSEIDLDTNNMEQHFQSALYDLVEFVSMAYDRDIKADFVFNRDTLINENDVINACRNSLGVISNETIVSNHPWVHDSKVEMELLKKEQGEMLSDFVGGGNNGQST